MRHANRADISTKFSVTSIPDVHICEAEVAEGLEQTAQDEIVRFLGDRAHLIVPKARWGRGAVRFSFQGDLNALRRLQTVQAVYLVQTLTVPRPRALLGDQHFGALLRQIALVRSLLPQDQYRSFYLSAAGSDTAVMRRLKEELSANTQLEAEAAKGDLLIRLRPSDEHRSGWEVLIRLTPRPLAARPWRVANYEGALNATVAHAMALMTARHANETYVNIGCGSGTLLIERAACEPAGHIIGIDIDPDVLTLAQANIAASGFGDALHRVPLAVASGGGRPGRAFVGHRTHPVQRQPAPGTRHLRQFSLDAGSDRRHLAGVPGAGRNAHAECSGRCGSHARGRCDGAGDRPKQGQRLTHLLSEESSASRSLLHIGTSC